MQETILIKVKCFHSFVRPLWVGLMMMGCLFGCMQNQKPGSFERPLPVSVTEIKQQDIPIYVKAIGHTAAVNSVQIRPRVGGTVVDVFIKGGDNVKTGDHLYRIDPVPYQIALDQAKANLMKDEAELEYAKSRLERYIGLVKNDFVSKLSIEEYKRDVKIRESQIMIDKTAIENAALNLSYSDVFSPIDGQVSIAKVDVGNIVQANDPNSLVTILQVVPIYVNFSIPQKDFQDLQPILKQGETTFKVLLPYGSDVVVEGTLVAINNQFNPSTGTIDLQGIVENRDEVLWPQQFVRVQLYVRTDKDVPIVPSRAVQVGQNGSYIYILKSDMTVEYVPVTVGEQVGDMVAIKGKIEPGMKVVTDGQINLRPGAKVVVIPSEASAKDSKSTDTSVQQSPQTEKAKEEIPAAKEH